MRVVIAVDSFKGCLSSREAGDAIARGLRLADSAIQYRIVELADGGEGTLDALANVEESRIRIEKMEIRGPIGNMIEAEIGFSGNVAVIESAKACGLCLVPEDKRNPMLTDSRGLGMLIRKGIESGSKQIIIGLGGSGVNDAGVGMLMELGYKFFDKDGNPIEAGGGNVGKIERIDDTYAIKLNPDLKIIIASDVENPLYGKNGASRVFGPQKGASPEMVEVLDAGFEHFAKVTEEYIGKDYSHNPGSGAAGGLGFALMAFLKGEAHSGIEIILETLHFDEIIECTDLVITGEGKLDSQTLMGKAPYGVMSHARSVGIPVVGVGGAIEMGVSEELIKAGFSALFPIVSAPVSIEEAMKSEVAKENLQRTSEMILRLLQIVSLA